MPEISRKSLKLIYELLLERYGEPDWWPVKYGGPFEIMAGAVLTQNTNWRNVELALANFGGPPDPALILSMGAAELAQIIKPAGFFNQKAGYLKNIAGWFARYQFDADRVRLAGLPALRRELLAIKGVGQETADSILLYAFGLPTFVIDAYTHRLISRVFGAGAHTYASLKQIFEQSLPRGAQLYNNYHALIVINAKAHCRKKPACAGCPLYFCDHNL